MLGFSGAADELPPKHGNPRVVKSGNASVKMLLHGEKNAGPGGPGVRMLTSRRLQDVGGSFSNRRGHASQLSISDPNHHVTEAIGTMYGGDDDSGAEDNRPLSFLASPKFDNEQTNNTSKQQQQHLQPSDAGDDNRLRLVRTTSDQSSTGLNSGGSFALRKSQTFPARIPLDRNNSDGPRSPLSPLSPTPSLRDVQADESQFPTNIDNPNDIAQELSNLQALRRMSMDVGNHTSDPDLLPFSGVSLMAMPSIAPTGDDDEADPSRLLWVPARVHPELEPTAFKNFLENRVQTMKRRSGESFLSADGAQGGNPGSLRRKKSMLSRQVNPHTDSMEDGADRLKRNGSLDKYATPELSLNELVKDPTKVVQKLAQDTMSEDGATDSPILPVAPGMGLRRSTKTTYRKGGSQRYGDRAPFSKRIGKQGEKENSEDAPPVPAVDPTIGKPLTRVNSEPIAQNYSRPKRTVRRQHNFSKDLTGSDEPLREEDDDPTTPSSPPHKLPVRSASTTETRTPAPPTHPAPPVPQIIETPPVDESGAASQSFPERSSSQKAASQSFSDQPPIDGPPARSSKRPSPSKIEPPVSSTPPQAEPPVVAKEKPPTKENPLSQISQPAALPGSAGSTTSSLTFVPTFDSIEKKVDRRSKDKDETSSILSSKSTSSWKWFKSGDKEKKKKEKEREEEREREKERERDAEREREEQAKKAKGKAGDNARLDVLQNSIDQPKGRESLRLDRDSIEIPQEKKETLRKSSDSKKERDGFFGGLFGGSKKKGDKEPGHKKKDQRPLTPEPPQRPLRPDQDYHWTRFPIIEERAIYRMAHIKLANPRRPLHSQVLLSNFMYSYLAKVQAMHPQLNVPISPQQKRQEEERKRREAEEQRQRQLELEQQMAAQQAAQGGDFDFDYHRSGNQYGDSPVQGHDDSVQYVDDSQIYEYEHGGSSNGQQQYQNGHGNSHDAHQQQQQQLHQNQTRDQNQYYARGDTKQFDGEREDDMW
ncbi:hypothetical protein QBC38DRAFT_439105 [Podospora fimiseda]|uniref:Protein Zds1 C-terminal domain-containing protein n=1 Tax=Podospora fimiseda TaxID=252190 RepID=A0AAN7H671_9PEZI|nr:hypothetical protein QBC38DRAFT_439105 [Podospora fimiseda]